MIWVPSKELLIKLSEILLEKGIGGLLAPWQKKRLAKADSDIKDEEAYRNFLRDENLSKLQSGKFSLIQRKGKYLIVNNEHTIKLDLAHEDKSDNPTNIIIQNDIKDTIRKEINVANAIIHAEDILINKEGIIQNDKNISDDWLYTWRDYASNVSDEELQSLWGKILAEEFLSPKSISLRTLDLVKKLSKQEAKLISNLSKFNFNGYLFDLDYMFRNGNYFSFKRLKLLEELGILTGLTGYSNDSFSINLPDMKEHVMQIPPNLGIRIQNNTKESIKLTIRACFFTSVGENLIKLCTPEPNKDFFKLAAQKIKIEYPQLDIYFGQYKFSTSSLIEIESVKEEQKIL